MERKQLIDLMNSVLAERNIPRNVRECFEKSIDIINSKDPFNTKVATITSMLDEASCDTNMSSSTRTQIWNLLSELENLTKS